MLILISHLIGRPVVGFDEAEPLGMVREPVIDPANGRLCAYFFGKGVWKLKLMIIPADEVVSYDDSRIVVQGEQSIRTADDEPKIQQIIDQKIPIFGANVVTESGKHLGRANDLLLDTELGIIVKYYVHGMLSDRIIAAEHIVAIEKRGIIVEDIAPAGGALAAEAGPSS